MRISRTSQYAIHSLIYIATKQGAPVFSHIVAQGLGIPTNFMLKVLVVLQKGGLLISRKGKLGGYSLSRTPDQINLLQILQITEGTEFAKCCELKSNDCSNKTVWPIHPKWKAINNEILKMLNQQTLVTLREAMHTGNYRLCDIERCLICTPSYNYCRPSLTQLWKSISKFDRPLSEMA